MKRASVAGLTAVLAVGLAGCPRPAADGPAPHAPPLDASMTSPLTQDAPSGRYGGTLALATYEPPRTFNPTLASDPASARCLAYVFDGLVEEDGASFDVVPALAESWRVSPDGRRYTFTLREGLTWHDGKPLTADDVVFTVMTVLRAPGIPWEARHALQINGQLPAAVKLDAHTVRFDLPAPFAPFLRTIAGPGLPILPKHLMAPWVTARDGRGRLVINAKWGLGEAGRVVGSGPFKLGAFEKGRRVTLVRNPHYYRVNRYRQPLPYLDGLSLEIMPGSAGAIAAFEQGKVDMQWLPAKDVARLEGRRGPDKFTIADAGPDFRISFLAFNLTRRKDAVGKPLVDPAKHQWFADARFRRAVGAAIDRQALIDEVYHGRAVLQNSPVFQKSPYYVAPKTSPRADRALAEKLLAQAGFKLKGDRLLDKAGRAVAFSLLYESGVSETEGVVKHLQSDLKAVGIQLAAEGVSFKDKLRRTYRERDWEVQLGAWSAGIDPHGGAQLWLSRGLAHLVNLDAPDAPTYPWEKRVDALFATGVATLDPAGRKKAYAEFQRLADAEAPLVYLPVFRYLVAVRNSVGNARPSAYSPLGASWNSWELYKRP